MKKLITKSPPKKIHIPFVGILGFERYLNRRLTTPEKRIISQIATQRPAKPILVIDPPGFDSTQLLHDYVKYRLLTGPQGGTAAVYSRKPLEAPLKSKLIKYKSFRNPNSIRGHSIAYTLLLNMQDAGIYSPCNLYPEQFFQLWNALLPMLPPYGFLVVHIKAPRTRRRYLRLFTVFGLRIRRTLKIHPEHSCKYGSTSIDLPVLIITLPVVGTLHGASSQTGVAETSKELHPRSL
ncbi:MAG: hypothetical protein NC221_03430 [Duncaniella sp.]|nr:hypothetical protein [Muribaculum sp.]MCM1255153.1 hypothetical protein [Duncaniella sp.]